MKPEPDNWAEDWFDQLCERIAEGRSLRSICGDKDMPATSTVMKRIDQTPEMAEQYTRAREAQADHLFDEILEIADDGSLDMATNEDGSERLNSEHVQRSRLRIDARKWMAGKLRPKKYGEKLDIDAKVAAAIVLPTGASNL